MKLLKAIVPASFFLVTACAAVVPAELRDARQAYENASHGPAATMTPAELHKAHQALEAAETAWRDDPKGFHTLDLAYVAQRKAEIAEGKAGIAQEETAKTRAQAELATTQAKIVVDTKAELSRTRSDLNRSNTDLRTTQANAASVTGQLTTEQLARQDAERRAAESKAATTALSTQLSTEQQARKDADKRASDAQKALARLAAVKEEARGLVITLSGSVLFRSDQATLLPEARSRLDEVAAALLESKERTLIVEGHTDSQGSVGHNNDLSQRRAQAVRDYLSSRGYPSANSSAVGYGSQRPVADNKSPEGRANNRRVEIVVTPLSAQN